MVFPTLFFIRVPSVFHPWLNGLRPKDALGHPWFKKPWLVLATMIGECYSGSLKSAIQSWLEWSAVRLLVHINFLPSGEKTGSTSAVG